MSQGFRWTALNSACTTILQFVKLAILTRLLDPTDFGVMAIILLILGFAQMMVNTGLSEPIIQRKNPTKQELSSLYWLNILTGFFFYGLICLITPLIASSFRVPEITVLLPVAAIGIIFLSVGVQFHARLRKALRFKAIATINISSIVLDVVFAVGFSQMGYGVWALVWGYMIGCLFRMSILVFCGFKSQWLPAWRFRWTDTQGYLQFSLFRMGAMVANYMTSRTDQILIGSLMGVESLGYYNIAFRLIIQPLEKLNPILTNVAMPVFAIVQDDAERMKRGLFRLSKFLMVINAPILVGVVVLANLIVPVILGEKWLPSVPLVQILGLYILIRAQMSASSSVIIAKGKADWSLYWNLGVLLLVTPLLYLASLTGQPHGIAATLSVVFVFLFYLNYRLRLCKLMEFTFFEYLEVLMRPFLLAITMGLITLAVMPCVSNVMAPVQLVILVAIGGISYLALSWCFQREVFREIMEYR